MSFKSVRKREHTTKAKRHDNSENRKKREILKHMKMTYRRIKAI